jgi:hypothetical protein
VADDEKPMSLADKALAQKAQRELSSADLEAQHAEAEHRATASAAFASQFAPDFTSVISGINEELRNTGTQIGVRWQKSKLSAHLAISAVATIKRTGVRVNAQKIDMEITKDKTLVVKKHLRQGALAMEEKVMMDDYSFEALNILVREFVDEALS